MQKKKTRRYFSTFRSSIRQIKTTKDGGADITITIAASDTNQLLRLFECKQHGGILNISAEIVIEPKKEQDAEKGKDHQGRKIQRKRRYPYR